MIGDDGRRIMRRERKQLAGYGRRGHRMTANAPDDDVMVRLIGPDGRQAGIVTMGTAKTMADAAGLDAVVVNAGEEPPVVRLADSGRIKYEDEKRRRRVKRNSSGGIKEIRLTVDISDHDLDTKMRHASSFLDHGDTVQFSMIMRGRKQSRPQVASDRLHAIVSSLTETHEDCIVSPQSRSGNRFVCTIKPRRS